MTCNKSPTVLLARVCLYCPSTLIKQPVFACNGITKIFVFDRRFRVSVPAILEYPAVPVSSFIHLNRVIIPDACQELSEVSGAAGPRVPLQCPKNPKVVELGEYVVREHNKLAQTHLKFERVIEGATQVDDNGLNFRLVVSAKNGKKSHRFRVMVHE